MSRRNGCKHRRKRRRDRDEDRDRDQERNSGKPRINPQATRSRLYRNTREGNIGGVCAGIADYLGWSPLFLRLAFIFGAFIFNGMAIFAYILLWMILPDQPEDLYKDEDDREFWTHVRREPRGTMKSLRHKFREMELRVENMEKLVTSKAWQIDQELKN